MQNSKSYSFIVDKADPLSCGWNLTTRMNFSYKYRHIWIVVFQRRLGTWGFGTDGHAASPEFATWQEAARAACEAIDNEIEREKDL